MPKLTIHKLGEAIVFRCTGRIGFGECHILRHAVFSHPHIAIAVLDMAEVTAIDASGLGLLVELRNWASTNRIQLKLLNLTPRVANVSVPDRRPRWNWKGELHYFRLARRLRASGMLKRRP